MTILAVRPVLSEERREGMDRRTQHCSDALGACSNLVLQNLHTVNSAAPALQCPPLTCVQSRQWSQMCCCTKVLLGHSARIIQTLTRNITRDFILVSPKTAPCISSSCYYNNKMISDLDLIADPHFPNIQIHQTQAKINLNRQTFLLIAEQYFLTKSP